VKHFRQEDMATSNQLSCATQLRGRSEDSQVTECTLSESDMEDLEAIGKQLTELSLEEVDFEQNVLEASLQEVERMLKVLIRNIPQILRYCYYVNCCGDLNNLELSE